MNHYNPQTRREKTVGGILHFLQEAFPPILMLKKKV